MYKANAGNMNSKLYKYWNTYNLINLANIIFDFFIGKANSKSLSFVSNNIPCDLYIPSITVNMVGTSIANVSIMYVKFNFSSSYPKIYKYVPNCIHKY